MRRKLTAIALLLLLFSCLTACAGTMQAETPPLVIPFEAQKAGTVLAMEFKVREHRCYSFSLMVRLKKGDGIEEAKKLYELLGRYGISTGVSIPLKLKVSAIEAKRERTLYEKDTYEEECVSGGSSGTEKSITYIRLKPGRYRASVMILKDTPELFGNPINLGIHPCRNTRPISP